MTNLRVQYHNPDSCNKCKGANEYISESYDSGSLCEARTKCEKCGFEDYWAYGFFESGAEMVSNCEKYSFRGRCLNQLKQNMIAMEKINEHDVIVVDSLNDANLNVNVGTPGHIDIMLPGVVRNVPVNCRFDNVYDPVVEIPNNKPWYQQSKGRRRSY